MTTFILISHRKAELELCDCPKSEALKELKKALKADTLSETTLEDLSSKVKGAVILQDAKAFHKGALPNENLYPYFFVGDTIVAKKGSEGYEMLTASDIDKFFEWYHGLEV